MDKQKVEYTMISDALEINHAKPKCKYSVCTLVINASGYKKILDSFKNKEFSETLYSYSQKGKQPDG